MTAKPRRLRLTQIFDQLDRYHWVITAVLAALVMLGFGFDTPQHKFATIAAEVRAANDRIDRAEHNQQVILSLVVPIAIGECLDRTPHDIAVMRLPCDSLLNRR